jgi:hypothetical protein
VVGTQLDLFLDRFTIPAEAPAVPVAPFTAQLDPRPQLDLFGDRQLQLEHARRALAEARAADACRELARLRSYHPEDPAIAAELDLARQLERRLAEIEAAAAGERPRLLAALARAAPPRVRTSLLRRAASELGRAGPTALLDDKPASVLLIAADDADAAWAAAEAAVHHSPRARFLAYLADVEHRLARQSRARELYRRALALDPYDLDWSELADDAVKELPDIAGAELELDDGMAWAAPVGVVLGVLPVGDPPTAAVSGEHAADRPPPPALEQARRFLGALVRASRERGPSMIDARREMRALAPQLLAAYLARR